MTKACIYLFITIFYNNLAVEVGNDAESSGLLEEGMHKEVIICNAGLLL